MAYILSKIGQSFNVPIHIYEADTEEDMNSIDIQCIPMGSKCHIINDGKWYMLNSERKWKAMPSGGVQSDWNQNDDTQPDYVKNRPFYTGDTVETVLLEETTAEFADAGNGNYGCQISADFLLEIGQTYQVSWDGTIYECVCYVFNGGAAVGNQSIATSTSDTGEPFLIATIEEAGERIFAAGTKDTSASHTFSISGVVVPVVKIDKKYLPSTIPFMEDGKIPEKYLQEKIPDAIDIFGDVLVGSIQESTLANPYPNKTILHYLTVEAFNVMLNDQDSRPRYVIVDDNVATVKVETVNPSAIFVSWSECVTYVQTGKPLAGAWVRAFQAKIHEDTDNPGTMVSECAVITVVNNKLT